ncbi:MAG: hypothetical protein M3198_13350 [Actinomycetota bacterium]|nr:hypothetical protein [Actinomycetota bacterium]
MEEVSWQWTWPAVDTGGGRPGFWYRRTPAVFGHRRNVGPLIACPDTNVLIWLYENLSAAEASLAFLIGPVAASSWPTPVDALRDLIQLWFWRDIRFWVDDDLHMRDGRKPLPYEARRAREVAVHELARDFSERGCHGVLLPEGVMPLDPVCRMHPEVEPAPAPKPDPARWPKGTFDRALAQAALNAGCHVLLTEDKDMLRSHPSLLGNGMGVMRPRQLLEALDASGELEPVDTGAVWPDLSALGRLYSLKGPEDFTTER